MLPLLQPITLAGKMIELQPLTLAHADALIAVASAGEMWRIWQTRIPTPDQMEGYIQFALNEQASGQGLPFVIVLRASGEVVGTTRYLNIRREHRSVEIGGTWIGQGWQRTAVNTEAKYQLLRYAFETVGCIRVEFKTDVLNERSRTAILRLGAKEESVLRQHMIMPDGRIRDTVYYSILDREWADVKSALERKMNRG